MKITLLIAALALSATTAVANPNQACTQGNAAFCNVAGPAGPQGEVGATGPQGPAGPAGATGGYSGIINSPADIRPDAIGNGTPDQGVVRFRDERGDTFHVVNQDTLFRRADGGTASVNGGDRISNAHEAELRNREALIASLPVAQDGKDGRDGIDGQNGADGKDGRDGIDGMAGVRGSDGANGVDGADGKDGANGSDGRDGRNGADGVDGADGRDGRDGVDGRDFDATDHVASLAAATAMGSLQIMTPLANETTWGVGIGGQFDGDAAIAAGVRYGFTNDLSGYASISTTFEGRGTSYGVGLTGRF